MGMIGFLTLFQRFQSTDDGNVSYAHGGVGEWTSLFGRPFLLRSFLFLAARVVGTDDVLVLKGISFYNFVVAPVRASSICLVLFRWPYAQGKRPLPSFTYSAPL